MRVIVFARRCAAALLICAGTTGVAFAQQLRPMSLDVIRVNDSLAIAVAGQPTLTRTYTVAADGTISMSLVGVIPAANLSVPGFTDLLTQRLDTFIKQPHVTVTVARAGRVFVAGEVKNPGEFPLTRNMTIVEALAQAGYTASGEVLLVRTPGALGPVLPDAARPSDVKRINLRELESAVERGDLSGNVGLQPNDTVFVPKLDPTLVYVVGRVRKPGPYSIADGTTVLQAVTLAGGPTDDGAINRVRISKWMQNGDDRHARLTDAVRPGDSVTVPEAFRLPSVISTSRVSPDAPAPAPFRIRLGSNVAVTPSFVISRIGADTSVFNQTELRATSVAAFGPAIGLSVRSSRINAELGAHLNMALMPQHSNENTLQPGFSVAPSVTVAPWLKLHANGSVNVIRDHWNSEIDLLAQRREEHLNTGVSLGPFRGVRLSIDAEEDYNKFDGRQIQYGIDLDQLLTERIRTLRSELQFKITEQSSVFISGGVATHRFPTFHDRDADGAEVGVGIRFLPGATVAGEVVLKRIQYRPLLREVDPFDGPAGSATLSKLFGDRTEIGGSIERTTGASLGSHFAFAIVDRQGAFLHQGLTRRLDLVGQAYNERFSNRSFFRLDPDKANPWDDLNAWRYTAGLGVRVGNARIGANASLFERYRPGKQESLLVWLDVTYGVFQVRER